MSKQKKTSKTNKEDFRDMIVKDLTRDLEEAERRFDTLHNQVEDANFSLHALEKVCEQLQEERDTLRRERETLFNVVQVLCEKEKTTEA